MAQSFDKYNPVSLNFDNTPITAVLQMLATQNNLNLTISAGVTGDVSINLENVSLEAALNAVLLPNGYNYYIKDNIVIIKPIDQLVAGELIPRTYKLKYIGSDVAETAIKPLLSANGKVVPLQPAATQSSGTTTPTISKIIVFDLQTVQDGVEALLQEIDVRRRQISVEVKIIENNLDKSEKLGINWPKSVSASLTGVTPPSTSESETSDNSASSAAIMPLEDGNWQLGYLSVAQLDIVLDFLAQRDNSKLLSNPRITTLENEMATIKVQTVIPIQTINRFSEGAVIQDVVTFQDEEVGIRLEVTPRVNDDSTITMLVNPIVQEIIGFSGSSDNQKPITSERAITTNVTVKNKETVVLGGLLKENNIEKEEKIFLLGSIPILGNLFRHKSTERSTTDLLIMITPTILD